MLVPAMTDVLAVEEVRKRCRTTVDAEKVYASLHAWGMQYGPVFRGIRALHLGDREALGELQLPTVAPVSASYTLHPALLDACFQVLAATVHERVSAAYLPVGIDEVRVLQPLGNSATCHAWLRDKGDGEILVGDLRIYDGSGKRAVDVTGVRLKRARADALRATREKKRSLWELDWVPRPRTGEAGSDRTRSTWLVLAGPSSTTDELVGRLRARGDRVFVARPDPSGPDDRAFDPLDPNAAHRLLLEATSPSLPPLAAVVHMSSVGAAPLDEGADAVSEDVQRACAGFLHIAQALAAANTSAKLVVVTRDAQAAPASSLLGAPYATLWGAARVFSREHPEKWAFAIDLDPNEEARANADALLDALRRADGEDQQAIRRGVRYVARVTASRAASAPDVALRADATYLITGGAGALGLQIARTMVQIGARNLVLVSRSRPSDQVRRAQRELEALGAQILIAQADVSRRADVDRVLDGVRVSMPKLRGIVHAAGVLEDGMIAKQDFARFARVLAPKVDGALHLDAATRDEKLDFFVLFSSAVPLLGMPGQVNYAAANAFLDVFAHHRRRAGRTALAIDWGPWGDIGMAAALGKGAVDRWQRWGLDVIPPDEGLRIFQRLLSSRDAQVIVLPVDFAQLSRAFPGGSSPMLIDVQREGGTELSRRIELVRQFGTISGGAKRDVLVQHLQTQVARVLGLGSLPDPKQPLMDLGVDSLLAIELRDAMQAAVGRSLPATIVFEHPTIEALAAHLENARPSTRPPPAAEDPGNLRELLDKIESLSDEDAERALRDKS